MSLYRRAEAPRVDSYRHFIPPAGTRNTAPRTVFHQPEDLGAPSTPSDAAPPDRSEYDIAARESRSRTDSDERLIQVTTEVTEVLDVVLGAEQACFLGTPERESQFLGGHELEFGIGIADTDHRDRHDGADRDTG